jgi:16S rRNA (adenine1518-N6/adenine1519-N6)-dimethyltransferase
MEKLANPQNTISVIQKYDFCFRKKFGQNFLIDPHVLDKIIAGAEIGPEDTVLEIGPGIGTLTQYLSEAAGKVIAVEIDENLIPILDETLEGYDNVKVIHADIMELDLNKLVEEENGGRPIKVAANLPYYITTPIIMRLFEQHVPLDSITVMVQKEVAARMKAGPGSKDYGALSLAVQYYAEPYIAANVPRNCFIPRPNVDSIVIRLRRFSEPPVKVQDEALLFALIRAAFEQRRKTLVNSMAGSSRLSITKPQAAEAVRQAGLPESVRGEALTLEQFAKLADVCLALSESGKTDTPL